MHIVANAIAILGTTYFIAGFLWSGNFVELLITALVLTAINTLILPVIKFFLGPVVFLTMGILLVIINAGGLYILDILIEPLKIVGYDSLLYSTLIIGLINLIVNLAGKWGYRE